MVDIQIQGTPSIESLNVRCVVLAGNKLGKPNTSNFEFIKIGTLLLPLVLTISSSHPIPYQSILDFLYSSHHARSYTSRSSWPKRYPILSHRKFFKTRNTVQCQRKEVSPHSSSPLPILFRAFDRWLPTLVHVEKPNLSKN